MEHESASKIRSRIAAERKAAEALGGRVSSQARSQATIVKKAAEDVVRAAKLEATIEESRKIAEYVNAKVQGEANRLQEKEVFIIAAHLRMSSMYETSRVSFRLKSLFMSTPESGEKKTKSLR